MQGSDTETVAPELADGSREELFAEIRRLTEVNRADRDVEIERRLLRLRHLAGIRLIDEPERDPEYPTPDTDGLPEADGLPDFSPRDVKRRALRAAILRDGCMIVRGFIDPDVATAFAARSTVPSTSATRRLRWTPRAGYYEDLQVQRALPAPHAGWIKSGGGLFAVDSPRLAFEMMEMYDTGRDPRARDRLPGRASGHLRPEDEPPQDRAHRHRGVAPGRRLHGGTRSSTSGSRSRTAGSMRRPSTSCPAGSTDWSRPATEGAFLPDQVSQIVAERAAGDLGDRPTHVRSG